jgi:cellulose synthase/poly-beta-1,6-N-acetylglucosamine synthase-like glycosyltransferase
VVADNCTDRTADLARGAGLECIERTDPVKRGKPFAIEWALRELGLDGVDAVVIVDADTLIDPGFAEAIASRAPLGSITLQAFNGVSNPEDNSITRMSAVFSSARYDFAFPLKERAGLTVPIQGAGSVIGGEILRTDGWRAFSICEDWELYALYTEMGIHMGVEPRARILAQEARSFAQSRSQRERWAAGKITVFLRHFFPLLRSRAVSLHQKLDVLGELAAPGPAVHLGMGVLILLAALLLPLPGRLWIAVLIVAGLARTATYTKLAIVKDPHPVRAALSFLFLPFYTVWRVAIQILSLRMLGDKPWVRTERHS